MRLPSHFFIFVDDPDKGVTATGYDSYGRVEPVSDSTGRKVVKQYDGWSREIATKSGTEQVLTHTRRDQTLSNKPAPGYDPLGRLIRMREGALGKANAQTVMQRFAYDDATDRLTEHVLDREYRSARRRWRLRGGSEIRWQRH